MNDWTPTEPDAIHLAIGTGDVVTAHFRFMHSCLAYCERLQLSMVPCAKIDRAGRPVRVPQVGEVFNGLNL